MAKPKPEQDKKGRFLPGNNGGNGRPEGSRNKLGEAFIDNIYQDWQANGAETIARVREERPQVYLKVVASILPKDANVNVSPFEHMSDAELDAEIMKHMYDFGYLKVDAPGDGSGGNGALASGSPESCGYPNPDPPKDQQGKRGRDRNNHVPCISRRKLGRSPSPLHEGRGSPNQP